MTHRDPVHRSANGEGEFQPSRLVAEGSHEPSASRPLFTAALSAGGTSRVAVWLAAPGTYRHPGGSDETFVVLEGEARMTLPDSEEKLEAGSVVHIPAGIPSVMSVTRELRKVSVIIDPA